MELLASSCSFPVESAKLKRVVAGSLDGPPNQYVGQPSTASASHRCCCCGGRHSRNKSR